MTYKGVNAWKGQVKSGANVGEGGSWNSAKPFRRVGGDVWVLSPEPQSEDMPLGLHDSISSNASPL